MSKGPIKRKELASLVSPEANRSKKHNQEGDTCANCKIIINDEEECSIQYQWCQLWMHSKCANLKDEECAILHKPIINLVFFCTTCASNLVEAPEFFEDNKTDKSVHSLVSKYDSSAQSVKDLSSKIESLFSRNSNLQMEIDFVSESTTTHTQPNEKPTSAATTLTILDELADREQRSKNLIVYNFRESFDSKSDTLEIKDLIKSVFDLDVNLTKVARLGRRNDSKPRPLLISLEDVLARGSILFQSGKLFNFDQHKNVYIAPDRTKMEREKHRKLVDELKCRRSSGEQNLVIRNGVIVSIIRRHQSSAPSNPSTSNQHS